VKMVWVQKKKIYSAHCEKRNYLWPFGAVELAGTSGRNGAKHIKNPIITHRTDIVIPVISFPVNK
jgi:hypothetical protein